MEWVKDFSSLIEVARKDGWATGRGSMDDVRRWAGWAGWDEVAPRSGDPTVTALRPVTTDQARSQSLSAKYGIGAQPLHTDGAHLIKPPDFVVLVAEEPTPTPTLVWKGTFESPVREGIFLVRSGTTTFLATAWDNNNRFFRFDPGCMEPADARARQVVHHFEEAHERAHRHEWNEANQILVVDNHHALHARDAVTLGDEDRILYRITLSKRTEA